MPIEKNGGEWDMKKEKLTIKDIAKMAQVSPTTVSLILNDKGQRFSSETIDKVQKIVKEYHYTPDFYAKNLTMKEAKTIGVIVPDLTDYFFAEMLKGIEETATQYGYSVLLFNSDHSEEKERAGIEIMISRSVSGLILATPYLIDDAIFTQIKHNMPVVLVDETKKQRKEGNIYVDEYSGMKEAVYYLYQQGHRRIAYLKEDHSYYQLEHRTRAYIDAMTELRLFQPELIQETALSVEGGYQGMLALLDQTQPFTAVLCTNDNLAVGAYRAIHKRGLTIPADISIMGFDDIDIASYLTPALTTIRQPIDQLGCQATHALINKINSPDQALINQRLQTTLVERESVRLLTDVDE